MPIPQLIRDVADFLYPGRCAACRAGCGGGELLCHQCNLGLDNLAAESFCERCALPVVSWGAPCPWCRGRGLAPFDKIARLGKFAEPIRPLIHAMKYHHRWTLAHGLVQRWLEQPRIKSLLGNIDVVVPVPLHWVRHIGRGYNQADLLASALARSCGLKRVRAVKRTRNTQSQTAMGSRTVREANVHGAFSLCRAKALEGKRVLVVDDVMTTAATLQEVGRAIRSADPSRISALVLAVADPKGQDFEAI